MPENKPRLTRLTAILTQLQSKRLVTAREIAEKHDVSIRTVYRDIRTLSESGIPITTEEGRGYSVWEGYRLPPVMFTEAEANALITAEQIINQNKDASLRTHYQDAILKVKSVLGNRQKEKTALLEQRVHIRSNQENEKTSHYLIRLQSAITNYEVIWIEYLSLQGVRTERCVEPFALFSTTHQNWILIAFCQSKQAFRAFRLDCLQSLREMGDYFVPHPMTLDRYFEICREKCAPEKTPDIPLSATPNTFAIYQKTTTNMQTVKMNSFTVVGLSIRTINAPGEAEKAIPALWGRFLAEGIVQQIPNKVDDTIYAIYTNYEGDHLAPYDIVLGCKVQNAENIPAGLLAQTIEVGNYAEFCAKGDLTQGAVIQTWMEIWKTPALDRVFTTDFEVYGAKSQNPSAAEVPIFISIR